MRMIIRACKYMAISLLLLMTTCSAFVVYKETMRSPFQEGTCDKISLHGAKLDYYYIDFRQSKYGHRNSYLFDAEGVPLVLFNGKYHYHPVAISQFALGAYDHYLASQDAVARASFLKSAVWLKDHMKKHGKFSFWEYTFVNDDYPGGLYTLPWYSAMAQGQGASVLVRAFVDTGDTRFLKASQKALEPLFADISLGGLSVVRDKQYIFPQEYPTKHASDILNGAIFAYFGVYDFFRVTRDGRMKGYNNIILSTLAKELQSFDTGYWSLYSRWPKDYLSGLHYNTVHVTQLNTLYQISGDERFLRYSIKFKEYQAKWSCRLRYVIMNHLRQLREFSVEDIQKIPRFVQRNLLN